VSFPLGKLRGHIRESFSVVLDPDKGIQGQAKNGLKLAEGKEKGKAAPSSECFPSSIGLSFSIFYVFIPHRRSSALCDTGKN